MGDGQLEAFTLEGRGVGRVFLCQAIEFERRFFERRGAGHVALFGRVDIEFGPLPIVMGHLGGQAGGFGVGKNGGVEFVECGGFIGLASAILVLLPQFLSFDAGGVDRALLSRNLVVVEGLEALDVLSPLLDEVVTDRDGLLVEPVDFGEQGVLRLADRLLRYRRQGEQDVAFAHELAAFEVEVLYLAFEWGKVGRVLRGDQPVGVHSARPRNLIGAEGQQADDGEQDDRAQHGPFAAAGLPHLDLRGSYRLLGLSAVLEVDAHGFSLGLSFVPVLRNRETPCRRIVHGLQIGPSSSPEAP